MGKSKDLATGETRFVNTAGDNMTGNLGIGTTSPNGALHVKGISDHGKIVVEHGGTSGSTNHNFISFHNHAGNTVAEIQSEENATNSSALLFKTGGTTTNMAVSHNGHVTKPNQPSFLAFRAGGNYTTTSVAWEKMILDGTRWNTGSHYSTSNHRFTAPVSGVYHFDGGVNRYYIPAGNLLRVGLYVNGSAYIYGQVDYSDGTSDLKYIVSSTIKLDANDYVELWSYSNYSGSNGYSSGAVWNTLSGYLVG